jgi:P-type Cu2+ transporter
MAETGAPSSAGHPDDAGGSPPRIATSPASTAAALEISLPTVHCAACISKVERGLEALDFVTGARVNLSLKRVRVQAEPGEDTENRIIAALTDLGYEAHLLDAGMLQKDTDTKGRGLLIRLGVAGFAAMNVMLLSISVWAGAEGATRDFLHMVSGVIALPAIAFSATPFFTNALRALRVRHLNMDVPISLAIILATGLSVYETWAGGEHAYFDAALSLTFFLLLGRYLDHRTRAGARSAAVALAALELPKATRVQGGGSETVALSDLAIGDRVLVLPGMRVPVDGMVSEGTSEIDKSLLTGESLPQVAQAGEAVHAGTLNLTSTLEITVTRLGDDTLLRKMTRLVSLAEASKNKYTSLAEKAAQIYAPGVHMLALLAFLYWQITTGDTRLALNIATSVLIITCPCALGLAVPAVMTAATGRLFRAGVLLKDGTALERLSEIDTVVFDKTGTLTTGAPRLLGHPTDRDLETAAGLARHSAHPYSAEIVRAAQARGLTPVQIADAKEIPGKGVQGRLDGQELRLGRAQWVQSGEAQSGLRTWLRIGSQDPVSFEFEDSLKENSRAAVSRLRADGLKVAILSGDSAQNVQPVAEGLGIETAVSGVLPDQKQAILSQLGHRVLMIGDGLNDAPALTSAHASMSPAKAIDVARTASDFVLLKDDMLLIPACIALAKSARRRILENFSIAAIYNAIAIPIALMGFATPLMAAIAMSASSICVSLNAMRLRKVAL